VVNASDVETLFGAASGDTEELWKKMSFIHIDSNMVPYVSPEEYKSYHDEYVRTGRKTWETTDLWKQRYTFSGKYGANLMEEVARYAMVAAQVARDLAGQFDVIHAHDWLTTSPESPPNGSPENRWSCTCTPRSSTAAARTSIRRPMPSNARAWRPPTV